MTEHNDSNGKTRNAYCRILGRSKIHKTDCNYVKNTKQKVVSVELQKDFPDKNKFCKVCASQSGKGKLKKRKNDESLVYSVVIDLEMCEIPRRNRKVFKRKNEIIQIGAVMLNQEMEIISEFSTYVKPEFGEITFAIYNLTGITESMLKSAPSLDTALKMLEAWMNQKVRCIYAWSENDYYQMLFEITGKGLLTVENEALLDMEWIDYQKSFGDRFEMERCVSLEEALNLAEINIEGQLHNGLDDAYNTALLIRKLEQNPDYKLAGCFVRDENITLCYSLGDLLASIKLGAEG